jgi:phosphocarrier protein
VAQTTRTVVIGSRVGLHARPASLFVQAVAATGHTVTITTASGDTADGASILSVLALGVAHGTSIELSVEGDDADTVADQLATMLASDLDAP